MTAPISLTIPFRQRLLMRLVNFYPPFLAMGIRVMYVDTHTIRSQLHLRWHNRNLFGTHFGGSLYAMCDPFFVFILLNNLGGDYIVWDKAASIQFLKPGRGTVSATFHIPPERVDEIRAQVETSKKVEPIFTAEVVDAAGVVMARVEKVLYVRRKSKTSS